MDEPIAFLLAAFDLKDETRTGWVLREIFDPESVADHSWGTALLCLLYGEEAGVKLDHAIRIAIVHDLAEAVTGDIARRVDASAQETSETDKARLEAEAMRTLTSGWKGETINALWSEYEARTTREALFVRDMNLIDMCLQATKYEAEGRYTSDDPHPNFPGFARLDEFFATSEPRLSTEIGRSLFEDVRRRYEEARSGRRS